MSAFYGTNTYAQRGVNSLEGLARSLNSSASPRVVRAIQKRRAAMGLPAIPGAVGNPRIRDNGGRRAPGTVDTRARRRPAAATSSWPRRPLPTTLPPKRRSWAELTKAADRLIARLRVPCQKHRERQIADLWRGWHRG